jgi:uncharacterized repeat protein (TIGR03847 family)
MRSLGTTDHVAAGAVGPPGRRTFFLEVDGADGREWFLCEKQQVAALAERTIALLRESGRRLPEPGPEIDVTGEATFRVAEIGMGLSEEGALIVLSSTEDDDEPVTFRAGLDTLGAMAARAALVVGAGRPPCRHCGLPRDPSGHTCPASNGDLRDRP